MEKSKKKGDISDVEHGPTTKEDLALINDAYEDNEMGEVKVEIPDDSEDKKPKEGAEKAEEVSFIHITLYILYRLFLIYFLFESVPYLITRSSFSIYKLRKIFHSVKRGKVR